MLLRNIVSPRCVLLCRYCFFGSAFLLGRVAAVAALLLLAAEGIATRGDLYIHGHNFLYFSVFLFSIVGRSFLRFFFCVFQRALRCAISGRRQKRPEDFPSGRRSILIFRQAIKRLRGGISVLAASDSCAYCDYFSITPSSSWSWYSSPGLRSNSQPPSSFVTTRCGVR